MKHTHNVIENSIFHEGRMEMKRIEKAKKLLKKHKFIVYERKTK